MTDSVQDLLNTFDHLADAEKRQAASEILRRVREMDLEVPSDDELVSAAEELFLDLDALEAADEQS